MIPEETVELVRESADIVQIIGEHVPLKRAGTDFRGPCPFHQGTHRNFSVSPSKNIYYCFVCHEGGDVFTFLRKRLGIEWLEAVKMVAARSGIAIPEGPDRREGPDPREPVWELNETAAEYFRGALREEVGAEALVYLERRGIDAKTAEKFGLGFAPREIGLLRTHLEALGYDEKRLLAAGLMVQREESATVRPRFLGRLMFPIHDITGHVVGFGGRLPGAGEPKYLNSSDSEVFSKGRLLYGLHLARSNIRATSRVYVVEGYFDVIRLMSAGVENVVAPLGTALTAEQADLVARYAKEAILLYDSDRAGLKATFRAGDLLLARGVTTLVATLPPGEDPDSFVLQHGRKGLEEITMAAIDVFERKVGLLDQRGWFRDLAHRRKAIDMLLGTIRSASDPIMRDLYIARASEASGAASDTIRSEAGSGSGPRSGSREFAAATRVGVRSSNIDANGRVRRAKGTRGVPGESAERAVLAVLLQVPGRLDRVAERLGETDFWVPGHRAIFAALLSEGGEHTPESIAVRIPESAMATLNRVLEYSASLSDLQRTLDDSLRRIESREVQRELREIDRQMSLASPEEQDALMRSESKLKERLGQLGGGAWRLGTSIT